MNENVNAMKLYRESLDIAKLGEELTIHEREQSMNDRDTPVNMTYNSDFYTREGSTTSFMPNTPLSGGKGSAPVSAPMSNNNSWQYGRE